MKFILSLYKKNILKIFSLRFIFLEILLKKEKKFKIFFLTILNYFNSLYLSKF